MGTGGGDRRKNTHTLRIQEDGSTHSQPLHGLIVADDIWSPQSGKEVAHRRETEHDSSLRKERQFERVTLMKELHQHDHGPR